PPAAGSARLFKPNVLVCNPPTPTEWSVGVFYCLAFPNTSPPPLDATKARVYSASMTKTKTRYDENHDDPAGYVDRLGYLRCSSCPTPKQRDIPVRCTPLIDEPCYLCSCVLAETAA